MGVKGRIGEKRQPGEPEKGSEREKRKHPTTFLEKEKSKKKKKKKKKKKNQYGFHAFYSRTGRGWGAKSQEANGGEEKR